MMPIPSALMPSTMRWRDPADPKRGMGGEYGPERVTAPVRFEGSRQRAGSDYSRYAGPSGKVWVDARNSEGGIPLVGALVSIDGGPEMAVRRVSPFFTRRGELHHTELEVG